MNKIKSQKVGYLSSVNEQRRDIDMVLLGRGRVKIGGRAHIFHLFSHPKS